MDNCIFCKIAGGQIPAYKTYEDDVCIGFLDIHPVSLGHMLLIPKGHYEWFQDTPDEIISHIFLVAKKLIPNIKEKLGADYVKLSVVGKDVPHFHLHLILEMIDGNASVGHDLDKKDFEAVLQKLNS